MSKEAGPTSTILSKIDKQFKYEDYDKQIRFTDQSIIDN